MLELSPPRFTAPNLHSLERSKLVAIKKALLGAERNFSFA